MNAVSFQHPEPRRPRARIYPVFLPFAGCPFRCLFCAQDKQTGRGEADLETIYRDLEEGLIEAHRQGREFELAFYGGTFTALPAPWPERYLDLAAQYRSRGVVSRVRCSTRPDCVEGGMLSRFKSMGLDMVELGIQSFDDRVLKLSGRGYSGDTARLGCEAVREAGLSLGVQLLPGLPGDAPGLFQKDVEIVAAFAPEAARLYPCLVIEGTRLSELWRRGDYVSWSMERTLQELSDALLVLWGSNVAVIRMGLAHEESMVGQVLAGPVHPSLGQRARSYALFTIIRKACDQLGRPPTLLQVPRRYQGELYGHAGELLRDYETLLLGRSVVRYVSGHFFELS